MRASRPNGIFQRFADRIEATMSTTDLAISVRNLEKRGSLADPGGLII